MLPIPEGLIGQRLRIKVVLVLEHRLRLHADIRWSGLGLHGSLALQVVGQGLLPVRLLLVEIR